jgi:hypothetical protein
MQISEALVKQIIDEVMKQIGQMDSATVAKAVSTLNSTAATQKVATEAPSMAGRDRINEKKSDYKGKNEKPSAHCFTLIKRGCSAASWCFTHILLPPFP